MPRGHNLLDALRNVPDEFQLQQPPSSVEKWICTICGKTFTKDNFSLRMTAYDMMRWHFELEEDGKKCFEKFKENQRLEHEELERKSKVYDCDKCGAKGITGYSAYHSHLSGHSIQEAKHSAKKQKCPFCDLVENPTNLLRHITARHARGE